MSGERIVVTVALEGRTDRPIVRRLLEEVGLTLGPVYVGHGKTFLDRRLRDYNNAARYAPWLVLRDLDHDAECAPTLARRLLPEPARWMALRLAVRASEAWLLADQERFAQFLGVARARVPSEPEALPDPKGTVVALARHSRSRDVRADMAPRDGSGANVGPGYTSRIELFASSLWRPRVAAQSSRSLAACLAALRRLQRAS